jgi:hypothetical protein
MVQHNYEDHRQLPITLLYKQRKTPKFISSITKNWTNIKYMSLYSMNIHTKLTFSKKNHGRAVEVSLTKIPRWFPFMAVDGDHLHAHQGCLDGLSPSRTVSRLPCQPIANTVSHRLPVLSATLPSFLPSTYKEWSSTGGVICKYVWPLIIGRGAGGATYKIAWHFSSYQWIRCPRVVHVILISTPRLVEDETESNQQLHGNDSPVWY